MSLRTAGALVLVLLLLSSGLVLPLDPPTASAEPVKVNQVHIQTFSDEELEVVGTASPTGHLVTNVTVPAGSRVLSASIQLSRTRYETEELALDATPRALWTGNLDRDGLYDDVIVAFADADRVDVMSLSGEPPALFPTSSLSVPDPTAIKVDDLDRDNDKDLLVTSGDEGSLYIFENLGIATFGEPRIIRVGPRPCAIEVTDLTPDFTRDVVVANSGGSSVTVLQGRGDLGFYPRLYEMGPGPSAVEFRNMDGDAFVDLVVVESRNDTVTVWYNEGNGNFSNATSLQTGEGPVDVDVTDMNRDSLLDIAVACAASNEVWVYFQEEDGSFTREELLPVGKAPRAVHGIQANELEDRNLDVVTVCSGSDNLTIDLAGGDLRHTVPVDLPVGGRPVALTTLRGNGDHADRMVVACQMPPSLVLVTPVALADAMKLGLGHGGTDDRVEVPIGTDVTVLNLTAALGDYVSTHNDQARLGYLRVPIEVWATHPGVVRLSDVDVWAGQNRPPRAHAGRNVTVEVGEPAELNGSASYDPDGDPLEFMWFVPGMTDAAHTDQVSLHIWTEPGEYPVLLVVRDPWDLQDQDQVWVIVNAPPLARGVVPATVTAREEVRLSAHLSEDPDGYIVDYIWDYGQGVVHGRSVDVMFTGSGQVNVTLEVVDDLDGRSVVVYPVEVLPATTPIREPAERTPDDRGEVPGPGAAIASLAILSALVIAARRRERP